jgi:hypothetical protein
MPQRHDCCPHAIVYFIRDNSAQIRLEYLFFSVFHFYSTTYLVLTLFMVWFLRLWSGLQPNPLFYIRTGLVWVTRSQNGSGVAAGLAWLGLVHGFARVYTDMQMHAEYRLCTLLCAMQCSARGVRDLWYMQMQMHGPALHWKRLLSAACICTSAVNNDARDKHYQALGKALWFTSQISQTRLNTEVTISHQPQQNINSL